MALKPAGLVVIRWPQRQTTMVALFSGHTKLVSASLRSALSWAAVVHSSRCRFDRMSRNSALAMASTPPCILRQQCQRHGGRINPRAYPTPAGASESLQWLSMASATDGCRLQQAPATARD